MAMSASCCGVRVGVDRAVAVDDHLVGQAHEEHRRDEPWRRAPGRGSAGPGRRVAAVVCTAPATMPSTSSSAQHHGAERDRCRRAGRGRCRGSCPCGGGPRRARRRTARSTAAGSTTSTPSGSVEPEASACGGHLVGGAEQHAPGDPHARGQVTAARIVRGSVPSGSTIRRSASRARGREPAPEGRRAQPRNVVGRRQRGQPARGRARRPPPSSPARPARCRRPAPRGPCRARWWRSRSCCARSAGRAARWQRPPRHSSHTRGSGSTPRVSSSPAKRMPFIAARQADRMISSRSPGTMSSSPSRSSGRMPGTAWAPTMTSLTRRSCSPVVEHPDVEAADRVGDPRPARARAGTGTAPTSARSRRPRSPRISAVRAGVRSGTRLTTAPTTRRRSPPW